MPLDADHNERFLHLLRTNCIKAGLSGPLFDKAVESTLRQLLAPPMDNPVFSRAMDDSGETGHSRGTDILGRILVEFCFIRTPPEPMIWPDNSEQDTLARQRFTPEYIPRPLMRYFLASIRGPVAETDGLTRPSLLTPVGPDIHARHISRVDNLIQDFKGPFGSGESAIDWTAVYEDGRSQCAAREYIKDILHALDNSGIDAFSAELERLRKHDPQTPEHGSMQRPIGMDDARQIQAALKTAQKTLSSS